jgi:hypothetical protein
VIEKARELMLAAGLSKTEQAVFARLATKPNSLVRREEVLAVLKGSATHTIDSHIMAIRRKIATPWSRRQYRDRNRIGLHSAYAILRGGTLTINGVAQLARTLRVQDTADGPPLAAAHYPSRCLAFEGCFKRVMAATEGRLRHHAGNRDRRRRPGSPISAPQGSQCETKRWSQAFPRDCWSATLKSACAPDFPTGELSPVE